MKSQIPSSPLAQIHTRNTKEAALLYALADVSPAKNADGSLYAFRTLHNGEEICFFAFHHNDVANLVHSAFNNPTQWIENHGDEIPNEYMPQVTALILQMWHNWERLKEATQGLPLHNIKQKDGKIYIAGVPK